MTAMFCECCSLKVVQVGVSNPSHVCSICSSHQFNLAVLKADHRKIADAFRAAHQREVTAKVEGVARDKETIKVLTAERDELIRAAGNGFADASESLLAVIRGAANAETERRIWDAYRARDRAMDAHWVFDERHHALTNGRCSCGLGLHKCAEYESFGFFREEYQRWELHQMERMREGKRHGLPFNHPEVRKLNPRSWEFEGMPAIGNEKPRRKAS